MNYTTRDAVVAGLAGTGWVLVMYLLFSGPAPNAQLIECNKQLAEARRTVQPSVATGQGCVPPAEVQAFGNAYPDAGDFAGSIARDRERYSSFIIQACSTPRITYKAARPGESDIRESWVACVKRVAMAVHVGGCTGPVNDQCESRAMSIMQQPHDPGP